MTEADDRARDGSVRRAEDVPWTDVSAGTATRTQVLLGTQDGMPHFAMRRFRMEAGGGMPLHTNAVEHEQYVLRGRADVRIGDRTHGVSAGDVVFIPAGAPHSYVVTEGPFEFLCMVPNVPDEIRILEKDC